MRAIRGCVLLLLVGVAFPAAAQEPSAQDRALARQEFRRGIEAAQAARWEEAVEAFAAAHRATPEPEILLNLGTAQAASGRVVEASESYERFIRQAAGTRLDAHVAAAREALAEARARIGQVTVEIAGSAEGDEVTIDGHPFTHFGRPAPFDPAPRSHSLRVVRDGRELASRTFEVDPGGVRAVRVELPAPAAATPPPAATVVVEVRGLEPGDVTEIDGDAVRPGEPVELDPGPHEVVVRRGDRAVHRSHFELDAGAERRIALEIADPADGSGAGGGGVLRSPAFWIVTGVLLAAGGVGLGVGLSRGGDDPFVGNFGAGFASVK